MRPFRSLLFVPGHKRSWVAKAARSGCDAVILDLEDSVPEEAKATARIAVTESIAELRADFPHVGVLVRPNAWDTPHFGKDLAAAVQPGLDALFLPKIYTADDIRAFAALVTYFEVENGLPRESVELVPSLETASGLFRCDELVAASARVASLQAATLRDGDTARELGFGWTPEGLETLYYRSHVVLVCRAAGISHPLCGLWQDIDDLEGLEAFARQNLQLGFRGQLVIHPSHVPVVNRVYTPESGELARYQRMIEAFEAAQAEGHAAVKFEGEHIDIAHVKTAREIVTRAESATEEQRS